MIEQLLMAGAMVVAALALTLGVGWAIGDQRGRGGAGALCGLLGPIGWIIAALLPPSIEWQAGRDAAVRRRRRQLERE